MITVNVDVQGLLFTFDISDISPELFDECDGDVTQCATIMAREKLWVMLCAHEHDGDDIEVDVTEVTTHDARDEIELEANLR